MRGIASAVILPSVLGLHGSAYAHSVGYFGLVLLELWLYLLLLQQHWIGSISGDKVTTRNTSAVKLISSIVDDITSSRYDVTTTTTTT